MVIEFLVVTTKPNIIYFVLLETSVFIYIRLNHTETKLRLVLLSAIDAISMLQRLPSVSFLFPRYCMVQ